MPKKKKSAAKDLGAIAQALHKATDTDRIQHLLAPLTGDERKAAWCKYGEILKSGRETFRQKIESSGLPAEEQEKMLRLLGLERKP